jgi:hypothetical protein
MLALIDLWLMPARLWLDLVAPLRESWCDTTSDAAAQGQVKGAERSGTSRALATRKMQTPAPCRH